MEGESESPLPGLHHREAFDRYEAVVGFVTRRTVSRALITQPDDAELYDEVTDDQYRSIVGTRLERDDFIVDDDGSGYVDNGQEEWGGGEDAEESDDEDDFDGEDEELRRGESSRPTSLCPPGPV